MEDSLKYFQPEISDIRVGYECETCVMSNEWIPTIISFNHSNSAILECIQLGEVRVPYLTKEQIEAEGWEPRDCIVYTDWVKNGYELFYANKENKIRIMGHEIQLFYGQCKDINTFRYIIKLLGI